MLFLLGVLVGDGVGQVKGETKVALIAAQALNKIKQQLPKDTRVIGLFAEEQLNSLSYNARDILKLF